MQAGAALFAILSTLSLLLAPAPAWPWRLGIGVLACVLAWRPARAILFQQGPSAVRRFEWAADGTWSVLDATARRRALRLAPETAALGPWILLVWETCPVERLWTGRSGRHYALLDAAAVSPIAFRALRGRLKLSLHRPGQGGVR